MPVSTKSKQVKKRNNRGSHKHRLAKPAKQESVTVMRQTNPRVVQRAMTNPSTLSPSDVQHLQRKVGNRAVRRMLATHRHIKTKIQVKPIAPLIQRTVADNIETFKQEHPAWQSAVANINPTAANEAKLDQLIANFKANGMGFSYTAGGVGNYAINGDCGSLARTFKDIATKVLEVPGVKLGFYNSHKGWYVGPGFREIDSSRLPNVTGGGYYFKRSHVWVKCNGTVYDPLFGEKGQNGREADEGKYDADKNWCFKIGQQWYQAVGETNSYVKTVRPRPMATIKEDAEV